ncbi:MAG TPA: response regulator transcription factor [Gammaproteobacteria bacterium]|nr:response regulator transcription factor [Gammaproteobacteria bacterium]
MRVLLVEDDRMIGEAIEASLRDCSYPVDWVRDGDMGIAAAKAAAYDVVLLDLGLPGRDGLEVLARIREGDNPVPVLIITARDAVDDRVRGLDGGADDYITKPFAMTELQARMRAVFRRRGGTGEPLLRSGPVTLDPARRQVSIAGASGIQLSKKEYSLLEALMVRPGAILSRAQLEERLYGWGEEVESNAVEYLIHSLRRKVGSRTIKNVRGIGWMISRGR